jgi:hypothetical protein
MAFPQYTKCCLLKDYEPPPITEAKVVGAFAGILGGGSLIAAAFGVPGMLSVFDAALIMAAAEALRWVKWWLYTRLICMPAVSPSPHSHLACAIGVLVSIEQKGTGLPDVWDTDYTFNLALAPNPIADEPAPAELLVHPVDEEKLKLWKAERQLKAEMDPPQGYLITEDVEIKQKMVDLNTWGGPKETFGNLRSDSDKACFPMGEEDPDYRPYDLRRMTATLHCEIEGAGMYNLITPLEAVLGMSAAAEVLSWFCAVPVIGWILCAIAILLTVAAAAVTIAGLSGAFNDRASPSDVNPELGDTLHTNACNGWGADILLVSGEWIYDSLHETTSNEIHPVQHLQKVPNGYDIAIDGTPTPIWQWKGQWSDQVLADLKAWCGMVADASSPLTQTNQENPENQWEIHPELDGCEPTTVIP